MSWYSPSRVSAKLKPHPHKKGATHALLVLVYRRSRPVRSRNVQRHVLPTGGQHRPARRRRSRLAWRGQRRITAGGRAAADAEGDLDIGNTVLLHQPQSGSLWLVQYRGTYWQAEAPFPAHAGQAARIAGKSGNILILQPLEEN